MTAPSAAGARPSSRAAPDALLDTEFPAEISLSSIETEDGLVVTASVRDVTERRAFEVVVADARDLAEQAARSRQEFRRT